MIQNKILTTFTAGAFGIVVIATMTTPTFSQQNNQYPKKHYAPGIWVDPDGCEHWVMDDGVEGYMTPHVTPDGRPVCRSAACYVETNDALFASGSATLNQAEAQNLRSFFSQEAQKGTELVVIGHTDSNGNASSNQALSQRRAQAVGALAQSVGANVVGTRGVGEGAPITSNDTAEGRAQNRRVEILCGDDAITGKL